MTKFNKFYQKLKKYKFFKGEVVGKLFEKAP
jgi:hypothetical protein